MVKVFIVTLRCSACDKKFTTVRNRRVVCPHCQYIYNFSASKGWSASPQNWKKKK